LREPDKPLKIICNYKVYHGEWELVLMVVDPDKITIVYSNSEYDGLQKLFKGRIDDIINKME